MRGPKCSRGQTCLLLSAGSTVPKVSQPPRVIAVTVFVSGVLRLICSTRVLPQEDGAEANLEAHV